VRAVIEGDTPHPSGDDRYAIYSVCVEPRMRRRIAETSLTGIGGTIETLREEGQLSPASRVGVLDRLDRKWIIDPWAKGDPETAA
jgi:hypothetical protein